MFLKNLGLPSKTLIYGKCLVCGMKKKKLPYWYRYIRYMLNSLWYHVLFPLGAEQDEFSKNMFSDKTKSKD